ncbi:hypothetical protein PR202_ga18222 [Eleusine coracana subsp. coracana]|uniref:Uncharacterized protein n=1 Tax=Eleusine coracana subsp. coracana TaxID=191504 RepID=A0AAV5CRA6_ELECO|nr:hypothetical protein PR202_ga18222 [Eleusine coracana subsp. coracana]
MMPVPLLLLREQCSRPPASPSFPNPKPTHPPSSRLPHQSDGSPLRIDAAAKPPSHRACSTTPSPKVPPLSPLPSVGALRLALIRPSTCPDQIRPIQSNPSMAATCEEEHTELELQASFSGTSRGSCA